MQKSERAHALRLGTFRRTAKSELRGRQPLTDPIEIKRIGELRKARQERYRAMTDEQLEAEIRKTGAKTRSGLSQRNYALCSVANDRGILDRLFPMSVSGFRIAVHKAQNEGRLQRIMDGLSGLEKDIIQKRGLAKRPVPRKEVGKPHGVSCCIVEKHEKQLTRILEGKPVRRKMLEMLKHVVTRLGPERIASLKPRMDAMEQILWQRRILADKPATLKQIGLEFSRTREWARQLEERLYYRLCHFERTGRF